MKILVAPNAFKGCLSAAEAAEAMAAGVARALPGADIRFLPMADGGDGLVDVVRSAWDCETRTVTVRGPLGAPVEADFLYCTQRGLAIIEMAAASGLALLPADGLDALHATSYGTGELIRAALDAGATHIVLGIGGSASVDGGTGLAQALGVDFVNDSGAQLDGCGATLAQIVTIERAGLDPRLAAVQLQVACDVDNPLLGAQGAAAVYGPQKGADAEQVIFLEQGLRHYAGVLEAATGVDIRPLRGAGAAGGLGGGIHALLGAELLAGSELIADILGLDEALEDCDLVLTGEGRFDAQSAHGKAPAIVARRARQRGIACVGIAGAIEDGAETLLDQGMRALFSLTPGPMPLETALTRATDLLADSAEQIIRLYQNSNTSKTDGSPRGGYMPVNKCLFPAAGYGTRFLPATKSMPKEMLPIVDKPLIQYGVEEAGGAGMHEIAIIMGRGKRAIADHFDISYELEHQISGTSKEEQLKEIRHLINNCTFSFTRQIEMKGLGDAILTGKTLIGNEPFGVILADDLCVGDESGESVMAQMLKIYEKYRCSVIAIQEVPHEEVYKYGVIDGRQLEDGIYVVNSMVEKPDPENAPSNLAVIGRYILTPDIFDILKRTPPGKNNELQLTDALQTQAQENMVIAYKFRGERFDCGSVDGFVEATNYMYRKRFG